MKKFTSLLICLFSLACFSIASIPDNHKTDSPPGLCISISDHQEIAGITSEANVSFEKSQHISAPCIYCKDDISNIPAEPSPAEIFVKRQIKAHEKNSRFTYWHKSLSANSGYKRPCTTSNREARNSCNS